MPESRIPPIPPDEPRIPLEGKDILVAVEYPARLERILAGHKLTTPRDIDHAKEELQEREFALIVLGVHFDESRMFELLRQVRTFKMNALTPVVCVLSGPTVLSDVAIEGLDHAVKAMLANAFLNLNRFSDDDKGNGRVRRIIDYLILIDGEIHGGFKSVHEGDEN